MPWIASRRPRIDAADRGAGRDREDEAARRGDRARSAASRFSSSRLGRDRSSARCRSSSRASCWSRCRARREAERSRLLSGSAGLSLIAFGQAVRASRTPRSTRSPRSMASTGCSRTCVTPSPSLLLVDDAHWADTQSLRWLDFLARRVADTPVLILVGARTGEADEPAELDPLRLDATEVLHPSPLSDAAVDELIAAELGSSPSGEFSAACSEVTGRQPVPAHRGAAHSADEVDRPGRRRLPASSRRWARSPSPARSARGWSRFGAEATSLATRDRGARRGSAAAPCLEDGRGSARIAPVSSAISFATPRSWRPGIRSISSIRWSAQRSMASSPRRAAPAPIAGPRSC